MPYFVYFHLSLVYDSFDHLLDHLLYITSLNLQNLTLNIFVQGCPQNAHQGHVWPYICMFSHKNPLMPHIIDPRSMECETYL